MFPSNRKNMCVGVSTILHGKGARRGTPVGRQLASGSSFESRASLILAAEGFKGTVSPLGRPSEISDMRKSSAGRQSPEKSTRPLGSRGAGPSGAAAMGFTEAKELIFRPAGACATAREGAQRHMAINAGMRKRRRIPVLSPEEIILQRAAEKGTA